MWRRNICCLSIMLLLPAIVLSCSDVDHDLYVWDDSMISYNDSAALRLSIDVCSESKNRNKSVAVFGGSLSSNVESYYATHLWEKHLGVRVVRYGQGGYGFSILQGSVQSQVDNAKVHDIYILWASTNDYTMLREPGEPDDYTEVDGYDAQMRATQCGGMNYCIKRLREINPNATIYVFGSLKFFVAGGYEKESSSCNELGYNFYHYVEKQKEVAERQGVLFFNQFDIPCNTFENSFSYYKEDRFHMTANGYANIGVYQLYFLATEKELLE